jgi:hypothetical protein
MNNPTEEPNMGSALWQSQELESPRISLEFVRHQALKLNSNRSHELRVMYGALCAVALTIVSIFLLPSVKAPALVYGMRLGVVLLLLGSVYVFIQVRRRGGMLSITENDKVGTSLEVYRAELQKRRDYYLYMGSWRSLWPIIPALIVFFGSEVAFDPLPNKLQRSIVMGLLEIFGIWFGIAHYGSKAREFQGELDALATLSKK